MKRSSIGVRLALLNAAVVAAAMAALGLVLFALVDRALLRGADGILRDEAEEVAADLRKGPLTPERVSEIAREEVGGHRSEVLAFRVTGAGGRVIGDCGSRLWTVLPPSAGEGGEGAAPVTIRPEGEEFRHRVLTRRVPSVSFGPVVLEGAIRLRSADTALRHLREVSLLLLPAFLLVALAAGYYLSRRALGPVGRMEAAARRIGTGPPGERLPRAGTADEIDRLAETLNGMLGRIEEASARNLRFAGDVAHEVRTPLATIRARLEGIPGGGEGVEAAIREVERVEAIVRSLLLIGGADEGASQADHGPVDLAAVAGELEEFFGPAAAARGIRFRVDVPAGLTVRGEATALRGALSNLVDNALHASDAGGEVVVRGAPGGGTVRLEILDRGCGVPAESRERVFERFFRAPAGRERHPGGSGLGLALVRAVARAHGGEATYAPRPGGGSVFGIELPSPTPAG